MDHIEAAQTESQADDLGDADDIERYVATFTEDERYELIVAEAAIEVAILLHRIRKDRGL